MAIIVEDGSNVAGANSYITVAELKTYAAARGVTLTGDDVSLEPLLIKAIDYINSFRARYAGTKTYPTQSMLFPRDGLVIDGAAFPKNAIPVELKSAQAQAAIYAQSTDLIPTITGSEAFVKREKVGPLDTEYSEAIQLQLLANGPSFPLVDQLLELFFGSNSFFLTTRRV